jgi:hypothetical protein
MSKPPVYWSYAEQRYWINTPDGVKWFDGPLEAENAAAAVDQQKAAQAERERIVAWLRREEESISRFAGYGVWAADAIEAGEHLT